MKKHSGDPLQNVKQVRIATSEPRPENNSGTGNDFFRAEITDGVGLSLFPAGAYQPNAFTEKKTSLEKPARPEAIRKTTMDSRAQSRRKIIWE